MQHLGTLVGSTGGFVPLSGAGCLDDRIRVATWQLPPVEGPRSSLRAQMEMHRPSQPVMLCVKLC